MVVDFAGIPTNTDGFSISGNYWHLQDIEMMHATHNGVRIAGHHNIVENCRIHDNGNSGMLMGSQSSTANPSYNLIVNCDAYFNFDSPAGGNADGFSAKWNVGPGNVFKGCRSYNNSDDGYDLWMCIAEITIDSCFAFRNGVDSWHTGSVSGNGNGFKLGGNYVATHNLVKNCVAFDNYCATNNGGKGFDENNNLAGQTLYNCTSFRNTYPNFAFPNNPLTAGTHTIRNCISYQGVRPDTIVNATQDHNSWQGFTVTNADFQSMDTALALAPRLPGGALPANAFFRLASGSSLIDAGVNVGLPFNGSAPDLGAYESSGGATTYTLNVVALHGGVTVNPPTGPYAPGTAVTLTPTASLGYHFVNWTGDAPAGHQTDNPLTVTMDGNKTVTANFGINTYTITASAGAHGSVTPAGATVVNYGGSQNYAVAAASGYQIDSVWVDGGYIGAVTGYNFTNVTTGHTIAASFAPVTGTGTTTAMNAGWNLISLPCVPSNHSAGALFPDAVVGSIWGSLPDIYTRADTLALGQGYWSYYGTTVSNTIVGSPITNCSITVATGNRWVLVGSLTLPAPAANLVSDPAGCIVPGTLFGIGTTGYSHPASLDPMRGYWVFVNAPCTLIVTQ